jgi:hypothetical protein
LAAALEPVLALTLRALPNVQVLSCSGVSSDTAGISVLVLSCISNVLAGLSISLASLEVSPRAASFLWHVVVVGIANVWLVPLCYALLSSPQRRVEQGLAILASGWCAQLAPYVTFTAWRFWHSKGRSCAHAASGIASGAITSTLSVVLGASAAYYIALSDRLEGYTAVVVTGEARHTSNSRWHFRSNR